MDNKLIGEFLLTLRKERNLTQSEIASLCNVSGQAVSKWERGESIPDVEILQKLSLLYNLTINELLEGERKSRKDIYGKRVITVRMIFLTLSLLTFFLPFVNEYFVLKGFELIFKGITGEVLYVSWFMLIILIFEITYIILILTKIFDKDIYYYLSMLIANAFMIVTSFVNMISGSFIMFPQFLIFVCSIILLILSKGDLKEIIIEEIDQESFKKLRLYKLHLNIIITIYTFVFTVMLFNIFSHSYLPKGTLITTILIGFMVVGYFITKNLIDTKFYKKTIFFQFILLCIPVILVLSEMLYIYNYLTGYDFLSRLWLLVPTLLIVLDSYYQFKKLDL